MKGKIKEEREIVTEKENEKEIVNENAEDKGEK
jgi:hypothetical protein